MMHSIITLSIIKASKEGEVSPIVNCFEKNCPLKAFFLFITDSLRTRNLLGKL